MTTAGGSLHQGLEQLWPAPVGRRRGALTGAVVALALHALVAGALLRVDAAGLFRRETVVEMDVEEKPRPLPPPELRPPPPLEPPAPRPRVVTRRAPVPAAPEAAPPPPNQESPPPKAAEAPPVFGVTMSSVVSGDSGMAVPVGNTLMTKDRTPAKAGQAVPLAGDPGLPPAPVPEVFIAEHPRLLHEVKADYPPDAQRMGIEGVVGFRLLLDQDGNVREVKLIKPAGHGFDEQAREALKKYKFTPARTSDGKPVPTRIPWTYRFELPP
jgi:protein TonB